MNVIPPVTLADEFKKDVWVHIGGLIAIGIGLSDHFFAHSTGIAGFGDTTDILFIVGGLAAQGVKIVNGSAVQAASAAAAAINSIALQITQDQTMAAALAAQKVLEVAGVAAAAKQNPPPPGG